MREPKWVKKPLAGQTADDPSRRPPRAPYHFFGGHWRRLTTVAGPWTLSWRYWPRLAQMEAVLAFPVRECQWATSSWIWPPDSTLRQDDQKMKAATERATVRQLQVTRPRGE